MYKYINTAARQTAWNSKSKLAKAGFGLCKMTSANSIVLYYCCLRGVATESTRRNAATPGPRPQNYMHSELEECEQQVFNKIF